MYNKDTATYESDQTADLFTKFENEMDPPPSPQTHTPEENGGFEESEGQPSDDGVANSANPPNSPPLSQRVHPIPEDSILHDAVVRNRQVSEAPDSFTIAPILSLAGKLLTPHCYWDFAGKKHPNLFNFVVGPPGIRKSTSFGLAEELAKLTLDPSELHGGSASDSALFEAFENNAHKLQIEDEGNTFLEFLNQNCGKELAARYLKLHDGKPWTQTFKKQANSEGGSSRSIPLATLSLALGGTPNTSKFGGIANASGLRRRFGYYVAFSSAKTIDWPRGLGQIDNLAEDFKKLKEIQGVFSLDDEARKLWVSIQQYVREEERKLIGVDETTEAKQASLTESPSRILKIAGIFEACRWAKTEKGNGLVVRRETLQSAFDHQKACLSAASDLETIGRRAAIRERADQMHAKILTSPNFAGPKNGSRTLTKSEITSAFANNAGRGGITTHAIYHEMIPDLIERNLCRLARKEGKAETYEFTHNDKKL